MNSSHDFLPYLHGKQKEPKPKDIVYLIIKDWDLMKSLKIYTIHGCCMDLDNDGTFTINDIIKKLPAKYFYENLITLNDLINDKILLSQEPS